LKPFYNFIISRLKGKTIDFVYFLENKLFFTFNFHDFQKFF